MKGIPYSIVKHVVKIGIYSFHKRIKVNGLEHIPRNKPVIFLPNHQNALIDVLLIGTNCRRKPYFLTRADVFSNSFLKSIFTYFRMLPIYRIRDGRMALSNNTLVFDRCADLLGSGEALVIFPETNHNLKRRVRPLSKGFIRIILRAMEKYPNLDIHLVPVGFNYKNAIHFPDEVALYFGKAIPVHNLYTTTNVNTSILAIKTKVTQSLRQLTTHIPEEMNEVTALKIFSSETIDFLNPTETNNRLRSQKNKGSLKEKPKPSFLRVLFMLLNFPVVLIWRLIVKPKVPEAEFMGTFRFATGLLLFPIYLILLFLGMIFFWSVKIAFLVILSLSILNSMLIKFGMN